MSKPEGDKVPSSVSKSKPLSPSKNLEVAFCSNTGSESSSEWGRIKPIVNCTAEWRRREKSDISDPNWCQRSRSYQQGETKQHEQGGRTQFPYTYRPQYMFLNTKHASETSHRKRDSASDGKDSSSIHLTYCCIGRTHISSLPELRSQWIWPTFPSACTLSG